MNHSSGISWAHAPPSPLLSPINVFTSTSKPPSLIPIEAANILLDLGRDIHRTHDSDPHDPSFSSEVDGLTETRVAFMESQAVLLNESTNSVPEPFLESLDAVSSGLPNSPGPAILGVQRNRKERQSKASVILSVLQMLKAIKVTATEVLELVARGSQQELAYFHSGFYATTNRVHIHELLDTIWAHPKGKIILEDWVQPHAIDLICKSVHSEMEAAKPVLRMNVSDVTPEFVSNWDIRETMEPVATKITPIWTRVLNAATQPNATLVNTANEEDDSRNRRTVCLSVMYA